MDQDLLSAWRAYDGQVAPFVLPGDEVVREPANRCGTQVGTGLHGYTSSKVFAAEADHSLHLGLCPVPFVGNPTKATIFVLMVNPGLSAGDYFAEEQPAFHSAVRANLKGESDFLFLDPKFAWHPGFDYWHGKLASVVRDLAERTGITYRAALSRAAKSICVLQFVPYHSASFGLTDAVLRQMRSPALAKDFVRQTVTPRVRRHEATIIATRKVQYWGLDADSGAVIYEGNETRAAHLSSRSRGGERILEFLAKGTAQPGVEPDGPSARGLTP